MMRGEAVRSHTPTRHLFHDDCRAAEAHILPLIAGGAKRFYVGHGGPIEAAAARARFATDDCPKEP
jgi:hypothetical protein